ncbi:hypothetical protein NoPa_00139 [Pseudomonas phage vB_PpuM-NoPa]|uniref:Lipoprotein n=4 Tax=Tartuvirus TaxID=3424912 RepID=A0AAX4MZ32_9CAUD
MKFTKLALATAVGFTLMATAGCQEDQDPDLTVKAPASAAEIDSATRTAIAQDERELKEELAKAQAKDPSVKDMYYKTDEQGNKEVVIVREVVDKATGQTSMMESVFPMMAGMMLGQMMASSMMMNAMAMSQMGNYNSGYGRHQSYSSQQYRQRKNMATSAYAGAMRSNTQRSMNSARYSGSRSSASSLSSRSSGAFSSSSSARSSGYSAGG